MMQTNTHHSHVHQLFICIYPMINYPPLMRIIICPAKADPANAVGSFPVDEAKDRVRLLQHKTSLHRRSVAKEAVRHKEVVHVRCKHLETIRLLRSRRRQRQKYFRNAGRRYPFEIAPETLGREFHSQGCSRSASSH